MNKLILGLVVLGTSLVGANVFAVETVLLLHFDGQDGSTNFIDSSPNGYAVTTHGNAQIDTVVRKIGIGSLMLDGNGDYLTLSNSDDWDLNADDFSIDLWMYKEGERVPFMQFYQDDLYYWILEYRLDRFLFARRNGVVGDYNFLNIFNPVTDNAWHRFTVTRAGITYNAFVDGSLIGSSTDATEIGDYTGELRIGMRQYGPASYDKWYHEGYLDELHFEKDIPPQVIPEPFTFLLIGFGLLGAGFFKRGKKA